MTTSAMTITALQKNTFLDVMDLCRESMSKEAEFTDADMKAFRDVGLDPESAAIAFIGAEDNHRINFIRDLNGKLVNGGVLTDPQIRAALNIARERTLKLARKFKVDRRDHPDVEGKFFCSDCAEPGSAIMFDNLIDFLNHKKEVHEVEYSRGSKELAVLAPESVLTDKTRHHGLDLSDVPDGYYALPDSTAKANGGLRFFKLKRLPKAQSLRNRRYVYGAIIHGGEMIPAGTIELREWVSDQKEIVGEQRPGEDYVGKYGSTILPMLLQPGTLQGWAMLFASQKGRCGICGKSLTTLESRVLGVGPECEKKWGSLKAYMDRWTRPVAPAPTLPTPSAAPLPEFGVPVPLVAVP